MISNEALNSASPLVDRCREAHIVLGAASDSILGVVVQSSLNDITANYDKIQDFDSAWVDSLTRSPIFGIKGSVVLTDKDGDTMFIPVSDHTATMDKASSVISTAVTNAMNMISNIIKPDIEEVLQLVESSITSLEGYSEEVEIIDAEFSKFWRDPIIAALLKQYDGSGDMVTVVPRSDVPNIIIPTDYTSVIRTGSKGIDEMIVAMLEDTGLSLVEVIGMIFSGTDNIGTGVADYWADRNVTLLKLIVSNWLIGNPLPASGLDSSEWKTLMQRIAMAYGTLSNAYLTITEQSIANKNLILDNNYTDRRVTVNGPVYDAFLSAGGSPEIIIGATISRNITDASFDNLLDQRATFISAWENDHSTRRAAVSNRRNENVRAALFNAIVGKIDKMDDKYLPDNKTKGTLVTDAKTLIAGLAQFELADVAKAATGAVCDILYSHTPAKFLLSTIDAVASDDMSTQEVLLDTQIEYIVNWVCETIMFDVNR